LWLSKGVHLKTWVYLENKRKSVISLNKPLDMSEKMTANGIRTHARTNQSRLWNQVCGNPWTQYSFTRSALIQAR